ncbi:MAG: hypothetical protein F4X41_06605 [Chloroflexi bacterium]|nr:hypothetical protein [Chloroflexota bacterium]
MPEPDEHRAKISLKVGDVSFEGEGGQSWLDQQVASLIDAIGSGRIRSNNPIAPESSNEPKAADQFTESLASYLRSKGGDSVQIQRFLATAAWLSKRGQSTLTTRDVSHALRENQQKRLGNAADSLNKNVSKGFCEKSSNGFFITPDGWAHLGERQPQ